MATRKKLRKINEAMTLANVFQAEVPASPAGRATPETWPAYFGNAHQIILELGCGTGAYTLGLAEMFPQNNYIGVDIKGARIWAGAKTALAKKMTNVAFLRAGIENIEKYFAPKSIAEIWITFPDPFPKKKQAKNRLTSPGFLERYKKILQSEGVVHLKTDDKPLFDYSLETLREAGGKILKQEEDLYAKEITDSLLQVQTTYEKKHIADGRKIYYARFGFIL